MAAQHADYSLVGAPNLVPGRYQPAKPGETILLYGVGFGPTNPPIPPGNWYARRRRWRTTCRSPSGAWRRTSRSPDWWEPGLYQFNVTVPEVPNGDAAVAATVGGVPTPEGVLVTVQFLPAIVSAPPPFALR